MTHFYVYGYFDPRTDECFYVGKGSGTRAWAHLNVRPCERDRTQHRALYCKLNKLAKDCLKPVVILISIGLKEQEAFEIEKWLIRVFGRRDIETGVLCNHSDGGEGPSGMKGRHFVGWTDAQRNELSEKLRNNPSNQHGRTFGPDARATPVEAIDTVTGKVVARFASLMEAQRAGFSSGKVCECARGKRKTHKGYRWRYT